MALSFPANSADAPIRVIAAKMVHVLKVKIVASLSRKTHTTSKAIMLNLELIILRKIPRKSCTATEESTGEQILAEAPQILPCLPVPHSLSSPQGSHLF